jgi:hypothetical protein
MTQFVFPPIDPQVTTGTDLAEYLNGWVPAVMSQHAGAVRPLDMGPGGLWVQEGGPDAFKLMMFAGGVDVQVGTVNPLTGQFSILINGASPATVDDAIAYAIALG